MNQLNLGIISIALIAAILLIIFLFRRNQKDRNEMNPDASSSVEEDKMEQDREKL